MDILRINYSRNKTVCLVDQQCTTWYISDFLKVIWDFYFQSVRCKHCFSFPFLFSLFCFLLNLWSVPDVHAVTRNSRPQLNSVYLLTQLSNIRAPEKKKKNIQATWLGQSYNIWAPELNHVSTPRSSHNFCIWEDSGRQDKVYSTFLENMIIPIHCYHLTPVLYHNIKSLPKKYETKQVWITHWIWVVSIHHGRSSACFHEIPESYLMQLQIWSQYHEVFSQEAGFVMFLSLLRCL